MKKIIAGIIIFNISIVLIGGVVTTSVPVLYKECDHGKLTVYEDNTKLLIVWGTHAERGFAYGALLGKEIKEVFDSYVLPHYEALGHSNLIQMFNDYFYAGIESSKYVDEAKGILKGMKAGGINLKSKLGEEDEFEMNELDLLMFCALPDMFTADGRLKFNFVDPAAIMPEGAAAASVPLGCSSVSKRDASGVLTITRALDWSSNPVLLRNQIMVVHLPTEAGEQPWVSMGITGYIGCLSGINKSGLGVFMNVEGAIQNIDLMKALRTGMLRRLDCFSISSLKLRDIVESKKCLDPFSINLAIWGNRLGSWLMHFIGPLQPGTPLVETIIKWINGYPFDPEEEKGLVYLDGASKDWCMVMEGSETGTLHRFLKKSPEAALIATNCFKALPFSLPEDYDEENDTFGYYVYNGLEADFCKPVVENHWDTFLKTEFCSHTMQVIQYTPQQKRLIWGVRTHAEQGPRELSRFMCSNLEALFVMPKPLPYK